MTPERFFCTEAALQRGEQIFGTAPRVDTWLLLEHPAPWTDRSFPDDRLDPLLRRHLRHLAQLWPNCRRLMIRQHNERDSDVRCVLAESGERSGSARYLRFPDYAGLLTAEATSFANAPSMNESFFLVCTHGKHDKCCAKFGFATYRVFQDIVGHRVWECSHVGGDRFAGNVVWMPYGIYLGHVFEEDVAGVVAACDQSKIPLQHYRGRCSYGRIAQAAEYFIRTKSGLLGFDDLSWRDTEEVRSHRWRVRFQATATNLMHLVDFREKHASAVARLTCAAKTASQVTQYELCEYRVY